MAAAQIPVEKLGADKAQTNYCPDVSEIVKHGFWWSARNGSWRNFDQSFSQKVEGFIGAQWDGVNFGKITCLYKSGDGADNFPIALQEVQSSVVFEPHNSNWSAILNGRKLCSSASVADCAYQVRPQEQLSVQDIYKNIGYGSGRKTDSASY